MPKIEKDLEVVEILKRMKWSVYGNDGGNERKWFINTKQSMQLTEEEAEKIKEWLEQ